MNTVSLDDKGINTSFVVMLIKTCTKRVTRSNKQIEN